MKKILLILSTVVILFTSCSKDFLERDAFGSLTVDEFFKNEADASKAVTAAYGELKGPRWAECSFIMGDAMTTDYFIGGSQDDASKFEQFTNFEIPTSNKYSSYLWKYGYRGINKTIQAIIGVSGMTEIQLSAELKNKYLGELYFLRAYYYYNLVRTFGDIPLILSIPTSDDMKLPSTPKEDVYAQIEADLKLAIDMLPNQNETKAGRITRGAAKGLAMRVNLFQGDFADVKTLGEDFVLTESYTLDTDIENVFKIEGEFGSGSVFEINFWDQGEDQTSAFTNNGNFRTPFMMPRGVTFGWGLDLPTQEFFDIYEDGDARRGAYILEFDMALEYEYPVKWAAYLAAIVAYEADPTPRNERKVIKLYSSMATKEDGYMPTGFYNKKFYVYPEHRPSDWSKSGDNTREIRLADVYLMLAEARFHEGGDVAEYLNIVRGRAGMVAIATPNLQDIYHERRLELSGEGLAFWDLVRTGRAKDIPNFKEGINELWPIPQSEIDLSDGVIMQNPGY